MQFFSLLCAIFSLRFPSLVVSCRLCGALGLFRPFICKRLSFLSFRPPKKKPKKWNTFSLLQKKKSSFSRVMNSFRAEGLFCSFSLCIKKEPTHRAKNERPLYARGGVTRHERARESEDYQRVDIVFNSKKKH